MSTPELSVNPFMKWKPIEDEINRIKDLKILPLTVPGTHNQWTDKSLYDTIQTIKNTEYTISVCGAVKAGKSTFLNALLFGDDILPTFDIPFTAKLTFVEYSEGQNRFEVYFYSEEEWKEYMSQLNDKEKDELSKKMAFCAKTGVYQAQTIGRSKIVSNNLSEMEWYATDPESGTCPQYYTPFVKEIHIYIKNDLIRNVRIVDTPGLNDSNQINSAETSRWIRKTHAMVFLLNNTGMNGTDLAFFNSHFHEASPESRVFVINKTDQPKEEDVQRVVDYLRSLGNSRPDFRERRLFGPQESICRYSSLIDLLRSKQANHKELTPDEQKKLKEKEGFDPDPDHVRDIIKQRLYNNEGKHRIVRGFDTILEIYQQKINILTVEMAESKSVIEDCGKSDKALQEDIDKFTKNKEAFADFFVEKIHHVIGDFNDEVFRDLNDAKNDAFKSLEYLTIEGTPTAKELIAFVSGYTEKVRDLFVSESGSRVQQELRKIPGKMFEFINTVKQDIINFYISMKIDDSVIMTKADQIEPPKIDLTELSTALKKKTEEVLPKGFWEELITRGSTMKADIEKLLSEFRCRIKTYIDTQEKVISEYATESIKKDINGEKDKDGKDGFATLNDKRCIDKLRLLETDQKTKKKMIKRRQKAIKKIQKEIASIEQNKSEFKKAFSKNDSQI